MFKPRAFSTPREQKTTPTVMPGKRVKLDTVIPALGGIDPQPQDAMVHTAVPLGRQDTQA